MAFIQNHPMIKNDKMFSSNTFSEFTSNNTHTCRELLSNKNKHIFPEFISNITGTLRELFPNNTKHFSRHQAILKFSESYCQTIPHFSRAYIKQY